MTFDDNINLQMSKRQRLEVVPRMTTSSVWMESSESEMDDRVHLQDITSFDNLLENLQRVEVSVEWKNHDWLSRIHFEIVFGNKIIFWQLWYNKAQIIFAPVQCM